jgi:hypothetical protein
MIRRCDNTLRPIIEFDDETEVIKINGVKFSYLFFEDIARGLAIGQIVRIDERRNDGTVVFTRILDTSEE